MAVSKLVRSTLILSATNFLSKILGFIYTFLIMNYVGDEAFGLYQRGFLLYVTVLVLATGGFPEALSILVAEKAGQGKLREAKRFFRVTRLVLFLSAVVMVSLFLLMLPYLTKNFYHDPRLLYPTTVSSIAIIIVALSSTYRGFFQGLQDMAPPAMGQLIEQIMRLGVSVYLGTRFLAQGVEYAALGLAMGMVAGEMTHLMVLLIMSRRRDGQSGGLSAAWESISSLGAMGGRGLTRLVKLGTPLTIGYLLASLVLTIEGIIIPQRLVAAGYTMSEGTALFGQFTGAAISIASLPTVFTFALATSLIPNISHHKAQNQVTYVHMKTNEAFRLTVSFGLPFALLFFFFPQELVSIFKSPEAAGALKMISLGLVFAYLRDISGGIIQGLGMPSVPVVHSTVVSIVRLGLVYTLAGQAQWGITGVALAYAFSAVLVSVTNLLFLTIKMKFRLNLRQIFFLPALGGVVMVTAMILQKSVFPLHNVIEYVLAFLFFMGIYLATLFAVGGITREDILRFPGLASFIK